MPCYPKLPSGKRLHYTASCPTSLWVSAYFFLLNRLKEISSQFPKVQFITFHQSTSDTLNLHCFPIITVSVPPLSMTSSFLSFPSRPGYVLEGSPLTLTLDCAALHSAVLCLPHLCMRSCSSLCLRISGNCFS